MGGDDNVARGSEIWIPERPLWGRTLGARIDVEDPEIRDMVVRQLSLVGAFGQAPVHATIRLADAEPVVRPREVVVGVERSDIRHLFASASQAAPCGMASMSDIGQLHVIVTGVMGGVSCTGVTAARAVAAARELNDRQLRVLDLIAGGYTNADIANELAFSLATVKRDVGLLFGALNCHSRAELVRQAAQLGLLSSATVG